MFNWLWILIALLLFGFYGLFGSGADVTDCSTGDGCAVAPVVADRSMMEWQPVTVNGNEGVILPPDAAPELLSTFGWDDVEDFWLPTEEDLHVAEDTIGRHISRTPTMGDGMLEAYRQYGGFVENGERKIFVNSFCAEFDDWRSSVIFVMDGGTCFWQAVYNVDTGEIEHIAVNGEA
jgi:hypothetical protein